MRPLKSPGPAVRRSLPALALGLGLPLMTAGCALLGGASTPAAEALPGLDPAQINTPAQAEAALTAVAAERRQRDWDWDRRAYACYDRFLLNRCLNAVELERRSTGLRFKQIEVQARQVLRNERALETNTEKAGRIDDRGDRPVSGAPTGADSTGTPDAGRQQRAADLNRRQLDHAQREAGRDGEGRARQRDRQRELDARRARARQREAEAPERAAAFEARQTREEADRATREAKRARPGSPANTPAPAAPPQQGAPGASGKD